MRNTPKTGLYLVLIILCVIGIAAGSFFDLQVSEALYTGDCLAFRIIGFATVIIFFASCVLFLGVLFRQLWTRYKSFSRRAVVSVVFTYLFCSTAALGGAKILNDPLLEGSFPTLAGTLWGSFLAGAVCFIAAFLLGFFVNGNRCERDTVKVLIKLILIFTIGFLIAHYLNCMIDRPSYLRLVTEGNTAGFMPWYRLPKGSRLLMSLTDLISRHRGCFVSGHALYAVLFIIIFPAYSLALPSLNKHAKLLTVLAGILAAAVILSRMLSGNNYLTDISFGALYSLKFCISYKGIKMKRRVGRDQQRRGY